MTGDVSDAHEYVLFFFFFSFKCSDHPSDGNSLSIISISTSSAVFSSAETPRDKLKLIETKAGWSFMRFLFIGGALAGIWFGWKKYGQRLSARAGNSNMFGGGGGGFTWTDGKRF
jgi:hypothetical protein